MFKNGREGRDVLHKEDVIRRRVEGKDMCLKMEGKVEII